MLVGAHVSVSGGYVAALDYAEAVGCECMQIFAKSPRQWRGPAIDAASAHAFVAARNSCGFGPVFSHTAYLINLATDSISLRARSIEALADELRRGALLGVSGIVTHVGNDPLDDAEAAARRVASAILSAYELAGSDAARTRLLLENTAGAGRTYGGSLGELEAAIDLTGLPAEQLGVCFDTCHGFAYGMRVDCADGWDDIARRLTSLGGGGRLGLVHANDCQFEIGSKRDRHAWIGDGFIGAEGFAAMMNVPAFAEIPACTEMSGDKPEKDAINIERLKSLRRDADT
jgi:deoxyribonuclease-4